jgi:signal transduction histidine kinase
MKGFIKLLAAVIVIMAAAVVTVNTILITGKKGDESRPYRVEAERIVYEMEQGKEADLSEYKYITGIHTFDAGMTGESFYDVNNDYLVRVVNGKTYRFDYDRPGIDDDFGKLILIFNLCLAVFFIMVVGILLYIKYRIIKTFDRMNGLAKELAKGNLTAPIEAEKSKYYGDFIWGLNILKDKLEKGREKDLELKRNNKSLVLSLSHDIKTPIGIIELNAKALERGLYDNDKEKKDRITGVIKEKCDEIKNYVDQIIKASKDDILDVEVKNGEFYLSEIMKSIESVYTDKMEMFKVDFTIEEYSDCLLKGDADRAVEVLQNLLENAIKYGDGREIQISFRREEESLLISVSNTGCTLDDTELPHIFDSFWRGSNAGTKTGSGLGLYICRQLMNRMNGDVFAVIDGDLMAVTAVFGMA